MVRWLDRMLAVVGLLIVSSEVAGQFATGTGFFGRPRTSPLLSTSSNSTSITSMAGSSQSSIANSNSASKADSGSGSSNDDNRKHHDHSKHHDHPKHHGHSESSASFGSYDGSGSYDSSWGSFSSSSSMEYECDCRALRRVSLMGASDYCLSPNASLSSKCGNVDLAEGGACPTTGAQPCSSKGHVLANDSMCLLDDKDETYKCVASKHDLEIQKNGGKKKRKKSGHNRGSESSTSLSPPGKMLSAHQVLVVVGCLAVGIMVVV